MNSNAPAMAPPEKTPAKKIDRLDRFSVELDAIKYVALNEAGLPLMGMAGLPSTMAFASDSNQRKEG